MPSIDAGGCGTAAALVVLAVLATGLPAAAAAGQSAAADRTACPSAVRTSGDATAAPRYNSSFPDIDETEDRTVALGDVAVIPLSVPAGANSTVTVGSADGYEARLRVDDDGDGNVTLYVNTYLAVDPSTAVPDGYHARGDDVVTVADSSKAASLEPGKYPVSVWRNGTRVDESVLTVTELSVGNVTARRAHPGLFNAENTSEIRAANRSGRLYPLRPGEHAPAVTSGETLVVRVDAPSLLGTIAAQSGNTTAERLLSLRERAERPETFDVSGPCGGIEFRESVADGSTRVLMDFRIGNAYVLFETGELAGVTVGGQEVYLDVDDESRLNGQDRDLERETRFYIARLRVSPQPSGANSVELSADENATVRVETNRVPGAALPIGVESWNGSFERETTATVGANGAIEITGNFSDAPEPGLFDVRVGDEQLPGRTGDHPIVYWERDGVSQAGTVEIEDAQLPSETVLAAYRYDTSSDRFRHVGSSDDGTDILTEGVPESQNVLVVAHRDTNGNRMVDDPQTEPPYRVDGHVVSRWHPVDGAESAGESPSVAFAPEKVTGETTPVGTPTPRGTDTPTSTSPVTDAPTRDRGTTTVGSSETPTAVSSPGFGLAVALVALLGVAALGLRRRR